MTDNPFHGLLLDEPPLRLSAEVITTQAQGVRRRRRVLQSVAGVALVAAAGVASIPLLAGADPSDRLQGYAQAAPERLTKDTLAAFVEEQTGEVWGSTRLHPKGADHDEVVMSGTLGGASAMVALVTGTTIESPRCAVDKPGWVATGPCTREVLADGTVVMVRTTTTGPQQVNDVMLVRSDGGYVSVMSANVIYSDAEPTPPPGGASAPTVVRAEPTLDRAAVRSLALALSERW